jgi:RNA polymerase sigma-70 factor (ECF subfamily)
LNSNQHIDVALIEAYKAGDKRALASLVERWHLEFCKKAYWIVKDADLSKDIAQESWKIIMNKLHTLEKPSSFKSWALRIVYSKSFDALRRQSRKLKREQGFAKVVVYVEDKENEDEAPKIKEALLKAVNCLPEQQQVIIKLFYIQEYSLNEISDLLGISVGTTKSRLFHAREKLKKTLKNYK